MHNIGAMVVMSPDGLVGIVSERDVVRKLHEHGAELLRLPVSEIMTTMVATCTPDDSVNSLNAVMTDQAGPAHPVVENGRLAASSASVTWSRQRMDEIETEQRALQDYITRVAESAGRRPALERADVRGAAGVLARAFYDDPVTK